LIQRHVYVISHEEHHVFKVVKVRL